MQYNQLGSTGLEVSVMSLGGGGHSRLGLSRGKSEKEAQRIVERALELGVNLIDSAEAYGTETVVGKAISNTGRDELVLSTKFSLYQDGELRPPEDMEKSVDASLKRLGTDYIDIYHLHGVGVEDYEYAASELYPQQERLREKGKIRFPGITEAFASDPGHSMLARAVDDGLWNVVMVGFNLLNQSASGAVLKPAAAKGIGTMCMFAVRRALSNPEVLTETVQTLLDRGVLDPAEVDPSDPFGFLIHESGATDIIDAAYRFCRYEPGLDTILTGTSSLDHLESNIESGLKGPLPDADVARARELFGHIDSVSGN